MSYDKKTMPGMAGWLPACSGNLLFMLQSLLLRSSLLSWSRTRPN